MSGAGVRNASISLSTPVLPCWRAADTIPIAPISGPQLNHIYSFLGNWPSGPDDLEDSSHPPVHSSLDAEVAWLGYESTWVWLVNSPPGWALSYPASVQYKWLWVSVPSGKPGGKEIYIGSWSRGTYQLLPTQSSELRDMLTSPCYQPRRHYCSFSSIPEVHFP